MKIEISDATFARLQRHAQPLLDTSDSIICRLLDAYEPTSHPERPRPTSHDHLTVNERDLWDLVIARLPTNFSLDDVYQRQQAYAARRPHITAVEASIRATLQCLRDSGYVEFVNNNGRYRRLK